MTTGDMMDRTADGMTAPTDSSSSSAAAPSARRGLAAAVGAVGAAFLASLCCVGPLLFVTLGLGAGLASTFEPLRPVFTGLTLVLLAVGFYVVYGRRSSAAGGAADAALDGCASDSSAPTGGAAAGACAVPRNRSRDKVLLWLATVLALVFLTFPQWSLLFV